MAALRSAEDVLTTELKEIYSAERQLTRAMPKFMKRASSDRLREKLERRRQQADSLIEEIDEALEEMEAPKAKAKNIAAEGLIEDTNQHMEEIEDERLIDPVLLASVQKIEHYCIASWGTAAAMGRLLGQDKVVETMERVVEEGEQLDRELTKLAEEEINPRMLEGDSEAENEEESEDDDEAQGTKRSKRSSRKR